MLVAKSKEIWLFIMPLKGMINLKGLIKMLVPFRTTANGIEYWDKVNKKSVFYPKGTMPTEYVDQTEGMIGQYSASGKTNKIEKVVIEPGEKIIDIDSLDNSDIEGMNGEQLRAFAEQNDIDLPANIKKEESIRKFISKQMATDAQ